MFVEMAYTSGMWIKAAIELAGGDVEDKAKLLKSLQHVKLAASPRGPVKLDDHNSAIQNVYVLKVEKVHDELENVVVHTFTNVSEFWRYKPAQYLKDPPFSKDYPPCKYCD